MIKFDFPFHDGFDVAIAIAIAYATEERGKANAAVNGETYKSERSKQNGAAFMVLLGEVNSVNTTYRLESQFALSQGVTSLKAADIAYRNAVNIASGKYSETVWTAFGDYCHKYCQLTGKFNDAMTIIASGGTIEATYFENGTSSVDVQVCFAAGFEIELTNGTRKKIEDFDGGEEIWARPHDNPTGALQKCRVVRSFKNGHKETILVKFDNGLELRGTKEHPFFVQNKGWTPLGDLMVGDVCFDREQRLVVVQEIIHDNKLVEVYNIEVEGCHTYYIGKDGLEVLVHNECPKCGKNHSYWSWDAIVCRNQPNPRPTTNFDISTIDWNGNVQNLSRQANPAHAAQQQTTFGKQIIIYAEYGADVGEYAQYQLAMVPLGMAGKGAFDAADDLAKAARKGLTLTKSQQKAIASYEKLIAEHQTKLAEYIKDPLKFDNRGHLKNAPNDLIRQQIIQTRINHLQQEIKKFQDNIQKIINGG